MCGPRTEKSFLRIEHIHGYLFSVTLPPPTIRVSPVRPQSVALLSLGNGIVLVVLVVVLVVGVLVVLGRKCIIK